MSKTVVTCVDADIIIDVVIVTVVVVVITFVVIDHLRNCHLVLID